MHCKGGSREQMNPAFHTELWTPAKFPAMSAHVRHAVWDSDSAFGVTALAQDDLVCSFTTNIKVVSPCADRLCGHIPGRVEPALDDPTRHSASVSSSCSPMQRLA